jgi:hypothetical protein
MWRFSGRVLVAPFQQHSMENLGSNWSMQFLFLWFGLKPAITKEIEYMFEW